MPGSSDKQTPPGLPIGPKESYHAVSRRHVGPDLDHLITRKCDLSIPTDRMWLAEQVRMIEGLPFKARARSWGYSWVFPAFVSCWKRLIEKYGFKQALFLWNRLLRSQFTVTRQVRLTRFLPEYEHTSEKVPEILRKKP